MGVPDLHVARHHLDEPHEVLQFRSDVVCGRGTGLLRALTQGGHTWFLADPSGQHFSSGLVSLVPLRREASQDPCPLSKTRFPKRGFQLPSPGMGPRGGGRAVSRRLRTAAPRLINRM